MGHIITLNEIKADHAALGEKINAFEVQSKPRQIAIPASIVELRAGEHYAGRVHALTPDEPTYDLIVTAIRLTRMKFKDNLAWAKVHGDAPTRRESALIYPNRIEALVNAEAVFWTGEAHAERSDCAWCQDFDYGYQDWGYQVSELFGVSVRRLVV